MTKKERQCINVVRAHYEADGRHDLPWRTLPKDRRGHMDPYRIHVSEVMLQQTQVPRVLIKYPEFMERFPTVDALASAPLGEVLRAWQGLGYNRRAKLLHACAKEIADIYPSTYDELLELPGVGPYTAAAIMAFAYNEPVPMIETNIRTVYLHHLFPRTSGVSDGALMGFIEQSLRDDWNQQNPREWYYALMDYGTYLKKTTGNQNRRSKHYVRQSKFAGSDREIRGAIVRLLAEKTSMPKQEISRTLAFSSERIDAQLAKLAAEGIVAYQNRRYCLP